MAIAPYPLSSILSHSDNYSFRRSGHVECGLSNHPKLMQFQWRLLHYPKFLLLYAPIQEHFLLVSATSLALVTDPYNKHCVLLSLTKQVQKKTWEIYRVLILNSGLGVPINQNMQRIEAHVRDDIQFSPRQSVVAESSSRLWTFSLRYLLIDTETAKFEFRR